MLLCSMTVRLQPALGFTRPASPCTASLPRVLCLSLATPTRHFLLSLLHSALTRNSWDCTRIVQITPLESALTGTRFLTPLDSALTEKREGAISTSPPR